LAVKGSKNKTAIMKVKVLNVFMCSPPFLFLSS